MFNLHTVLGPSIPKPSEAGGFSSKGHVLLELSGGEIQSLLIARVLVQETSAILLDEPTANLDIGRQMDMLELIRGLCREKKITAMAALHDLNLAAQYCDRLLLIDDTGIYAQGSPLEVITEANIKQVYGVENCVFKHPVNGLPAVILSASSSKPDSGI